MALAYSNITVELKEISLSNRPQELYDLSPKGTVPVLYINNQTVIDESLDIMQWALKHNNQQNWFLDKKKFQLEMIQECDNEFKYWLDRFKYYDRHPENNKTYYRGKCDNYLSQLNIQLQTTTYLISNKLSLLDIAIFPLIRQFANVDNNWLINHHCNVANWVDCIMKSKLFLSVMDKYLLY
ncbi:glutathione S-transferase N-terminal domain-containing protein, partial [Candidatus Pelagibacter communis]|uniref:glutathione S-transferase N-terminal domain-containing protein n=1 Tax=Pelagibacter ubique TaxID=198252 RepID=UPI00211BD395